MKLLYAEDEKAMSEAVCDVLTFHKYSVDPVYDGEEALEYLKHEKYDGVILDVMMPRKDGIRVLREMREAGNNTPVLLLTAKGETEDKIKGLDFGADDYLTKPFNMGELMARVRAMLRRREEFTPTVLHFGNTDLNTMDYSLSAPGGSVTLPNIEYRMMELFMLNRGQYLSTEDILVKVWGWDTDAEAGAVWVYISYLRKRLASVGSDIQIVAKRNTGYTIAVNQVK